MSHNTCYDVVLLIPRSLNYLIDRMWDDLGLVKVYTKKRGAPPDLFDPICMRKGSTIEVLTKALAPPNTHVLFRMSATGSIGRWQLISVMR